MHPLALLPRAVPVATGRLGAPASGTAITLVQPGRGDVRDLALLYLTGQWALMLAQTLGEDVCVVAEPAHTYENTPSYDALIAWAQQQAGGFTPGRLWLIGFSNGCVAVRDALALGAPASVVLAADGIHLPRNEPTPAWAQTWVEAFDAARARQLVLSVSVSQTAANSYTTRESAEILFQTPVCLGSYSAPCVQRDGLFSYYGATLLPGGNAANEHIDQLRVLLPRMISDAQKNLAPAPASPSSRLVKGAVGVGALALLFLAARALARR